MGKSVSTEFNEEVLKAHNEYRKQHGVPPLMLCKKLNREAQQTLRSHGLEEYQEDGSGEGICK
ncbi:Golgi-associated plant pathogenesis-related protein 1-like isoform X3 [Tupaia chinensis]|uniref:Golgi-associated plant pathogenesis-related protein 1-like isoform X3 n=1 Tax=Tupaia chinensis TaxID=246437 RepID=UPI000FFBC23E|nr:Golgi-associated plant pathogenesis-related protein 1-like isoform X3 [Tupaia chinensis]